MLFIVPFLLYMGIVFAIPLGLIVYTSLFVEGSAQLTFEFYQAFFTKPLYLRVLWNTIEISFVGAAIALLVGYPVAYYLAKQPPRKRLYLSLFLLLPFYTSILVKSFAFTIILGYNGAINWFLRQLLGDDFAVELLFNRTGVMFGIVHDKLPFMVFPILASLMAQNPAVHKAAEIMGASRTRIFWQVTFPLSLPGIVAGLLLVTVRSMGQFVAPALLGGRHDLMMANLVDFHINEALDWGMASAISLVLLLLSSIFLIALVRLPGGQIFGERA